MRLMTTDCQNGKRIQVKTSTTPLNDCVQLENVYFRI
jgi:hypothetical protein